MRNIVPAFVVLLISAVPAQADNTFHVALGGGASHFATRCDGDACDRRDVGWRVALGWRFRERWSVEAAWLDAGKFIASDVTASATPFNGRAAVRAYGATVAYSWPLNPSLSLDARAGAASVDADFSPGPAPAVALGRTVTRPLYGFTARWRLAPRWSLRADWDGTAGRMNRYDGRLDLFSVGLQYEF
jgi:hypothetical protein